MTADTGVRAEGAEELVLLECCVRGDRFVPVKGAKPRRLGWKEAVELLAPHGSRDGMAQIRRAKKGSFLGVIKNRLTGSPGTFFMHNLDCSGDLRRPLKVDPKLEERILSAYQVLETKWAREIEEIGAVT